MYLFTFTRSSWDETEVVQIAALSSGRAEELLNNDGRPARLYNLETVFELGRGYKEGFEFCAHFEHKKENK